MKIYEDINANTGFANGMIIFATDGGVMLFCLPKKTLKVYNNSPNATNTIDILEISKLQSVLPAGALLFSDVKDSTGTAYSGTLNGTINALNNFFFDASSEAGGAWGVIGRGGSFIDGQRNNAGAFINSSNLLADTLYMFPFLVQRGTINSTAFRVEFGIGKVVVGIYNSDNMNEAKSKIWQCSEINNLVATDYSFTGLIVPCESGVYWMAILSNSTFRFRAVAETDVFNIIGRGNNVSSRETNRKTAALVYTSTLPNPAPILTGQNSTFNIPILNFVKS